MPEKPTKILVLIMLLLLVGVGFYAYDVYIYQKKLQKIINLNKKIEKQNEQLISAQILDQNLSGVASLINTNLAISENDPLITTSAVPFLKFVTTTLNEMQIELMSIQPRPAVSKKNYVEHAYSLQVFCNYRKFAELLNRIEKNDRMIVVNSFEVKSNIEYLLGRDHPNGIDKRVIEFDISTITLLKKEM